MSKLFYILLALSCMACDFRDDPPKPKIKGAKSVGMIDNTHEVVAFHDDINSATCYVVIPAFDHQSYSISCVKDEALLQSK